MLLESLTIPLRDIVQYLAALKLIWLALFNKMNSTKATALFLLQCGNLYQKEGFYSLFHPK